MFTTALVALLLPALAAAQYGDPAPATTSSPTATSAAPVPSAPADTAGHMNIDVAPNATFSFHPNNIKAPNGTLVTFWIPDQGFDHSITQSSFATPCTYLNSSANATASTNSTVSTNSTAVGFDSGLQSKMRFTINITDDTKPIWFHCKQLLHCGMGMVGSINAPDSGNTFEAFQAAALKIAGAEIQETDNGFVAGGINAVATGPPVLSTTPVGSGATTLTTSTGLALVAGAIAFILV